MRWTQFLLINIGLIFNLAVSAQDRFEFKGHVVADDIPVIGASIQIKGTHRGTITDLNGNFSLDVLHGETILITYIGHLVCQHIVEDVSISNLIGENKTLRFVFQLFENNKKGRKKAKAAQDQYRILLEEISTIPPTKAHIPVEEKSGPLRNTGVGRIIHREIKESPTIPAAPVIHVVPPEGYPYFNTQNITIKYATESSTPLQEFRVTVNGELQPAARAVRKGNSIQLELPEKDCNISFQVRNQSAWSETVYLNLKWDDSREPIIRPNLHVLAVGIDQYRHINKLALAVKDMNDFVKVVHKKKDLPYKEIFSTKLQNEEATLFSIKKELEEIRRKADEDDFTFIFFAGHGLHDEKGRYYLAPVDADLSSIRASCFEKDEFIRFIEEIPGKVIVFVDACYSGSLLKGTRNAMENTVIEMKFAKPGYYFYASSQEDVVSRELNEWGNGAFTKALIEAFEGKARKGTEEKLTTYDLNVFLKKRVREINNRQSPSSDGWNQPFPLFMY